MFKLGRNYVSAKMAVSYTHLDVYKRQLKENAKIRYLENKFLCHYDY